MKNTFQGYTADENLPFKKGEFITLPKGTLFHHRGELQETKRTYKVKVDHMLNGSDMCVGHFYTDRQEAHLTYYNRHDADWVKKTYGTDDLTQLWPLMKVVRYGRDDRHVAIYLPMSNPEVRWAGKGGYWSSADINQLVAA